MMMMMMMMMKMKMKMIETEDKDFGILGFFFSMDFGLILSWVWDGFSGFELIFSCFCVDFELFLVWFCSFCVRNIKG